MSNKQGPGGFSPVRAKVADTQGRIMPFVCADRSANTANNAGDVYLGDAVMLSGGLIVPAYTGQPILGVAVAFGIVNPADPLAVPLAFNYNNPQNSPGYASLATATGLTVFVALSEDWIFEVQSAIALDYHVGSTADINIAASTTAHGSRITGQSSMMLTTSSSNDMEVVENLYRVNNTHNSAYEIYRVAFKPVATNYL